jgi:hypothetical protein
MDDHGQYPYLTKGDVITLDTTVGISGLTGTVVAVDLEPDGGLRCLSLQVEDPTAGTMVLHVAGPVIALWRHGAPVRQQLPKGIAIPNGLPPGLPLGLQPRRGPGG